MDMSEPRSRDKTALSVLNESKDFGVCIISLV